MPLQVFTTKNIQDEFFIQLAYIYNYVGVCMYEKSEIGGDNL